MPLKLMLTGLEFALDNTRLRIGRADHLEVSIHGDPLISSNHCIIDSTVLLDAASTNGTSINGQKIKHDTRVQVKHGDVITLGETALYVVEGVPGDGVAPTTADGKAIEMSTKGGTGKQAKKKEAAGGSKSSSSSARSKHKAGHEREGSASALAAIASSAAPSPASSISTMYRPSPTVPNSPNNHHPANITAIIPTSAVATSTFNFIDQSRPLPTGPSMASTANAATGPSTSGSQRASRSSSFNSRTTDTDRSRLLDLSQASLDDSMNAEGLLDLSAPPGRVHGEGQVGDVDDSAMELDEDSINISMDSTAARALDPVHRINALSNNNNSSDISAHPAAPPPPYQLPSPSSATSSAASHISPSSRSLDTTRLAGDGGGLDDSPQTQQMRKLQDALRDSELRAGELKRKLSHTQRRVSGAQVDATNRQAARVSELEGQVASLSYQLLYGAGPKDQEIQRLSEELSKLRVDSDKHKDAAADAQRNGSVKEERLTAEEVAARAEKDKQALTAITDASALLSTTRTELMAAVAEYSTHMNALLSMQQTLAAQQQLLVEATRTAPKDQEGSGTNRDDSYHQLMTAVNSAAQSTVTALAADKKGRDEQETEWKRELATITTQLSAVNQSINSLHDKVAAVKVEDQLEGEKAETSELRRRKGRGEEESKQKEGEAHTTISDNSPSKQPSPTPVTSVPTFAAKTTTTMASSSTAALQSDVSGLKSQVSSISGQLQQVWVMVIVLLALSVLLLLARRT